MDTQYFAVKADTKSTAELNLHPTWKLRFETNSCSYRWNYLNRCLRHPWSSYSRLSLGPNLNWTSTLEGAITI